MPRFFFARSLHNEVMNFEQLDKAMRVYEAANDTVVLPGIYMVARIDGRAFTQLTRNVHAFDAPYDEGFRDCMTGTVEHLMDCGFRVVYGYTQSDEISLLFHFNEETFGRKIRKFNSVLAGEASAKFSLLLGTGTVAAFDCRICQLPNLELVLDYFRWRAEDAHRNALNAHCYWTLRDQGQTAKEATTNLLGLSVSDKNEFLFKEAGVNFNDLPTWQRRGIGVYKENYTVTGVNPKTGEELPGVRTQNKVDFELPVKEAYTDFIVQLIHRSNGQT